MSIIGAPERATQKRVIQVFTQELGYTYLGDWHQRDGNSNIEEVLLESNLIKRGYDAAQIAKAMFMLQSVANHPNRTLYDKNKSVYELLRYGANVQVAAGENAETVHLIDWGDVYANDFAIAEEVTLHGNQTRRPDLVLYVNGLAIGVIELKNSRVSIGDGIRQNISNQSAEFNPWFFSTVQFLFAGNDSEGLQYGTIGTPEKFYLRWKEDARDNSRLKLDKYLIKMCSKERRPREASPSWPGRGHASAGEHAGPTGAVQQPAQE